MQEHLGVEERPEPRVEVVPEEPKTGPDPMKTAGTQPKKRWIWLGGGLSIVLLLVAAYWAFWQRGPAVKEKVPFLGAIVPADTIDEACLPGAIRPDEGKNLVVLELERNVGQRVDAAKPERNVFCRQTAVLVVASQLVLPL